MDKIFALNTFNMYDNVASNVYHLVQKIEITVNQLKQTIKVWEHRRNSRKELARLSPRMLKDIGLTKGETWAEINKPFWEN